MAPTFLVVTTHEELEAAKAHSVHPPQPDHTPVFCHDIASVGSFVQGLSPAPVVAIITNVYTEAQQAKAKADILAVHPGIRVVVVPQGLKGEEIKKFMDQDRANALAGK